MLNLFDIDDYASFVYLLDEMGRNVMLNEESTPVKALITNTKLEQQYDDRRISTLEPLQRGDTIDWKGKVYMIISEVNDQRYGHYKANMRLLPHRIVINKNCNMQNVPCYFESGNPSLKHGQVMTLLDDRIKVYVPSYKLDATTTFAAEFMINGNKFKIISVDGYTQLGISILTCEREQINIATDDLVNNIAGGLTCFIEPEPEEPEEPTDGKRIIVTDSRSANYRESDYIYLRFGQIATFTANVYDGETVIDEPVLFELYTDDKNAPADGSKYSVEINGNAVTINAKQAVYFIQIKILLANDASVFTWQRIRIKGLY